MRTCLAPFFLGRPEPGLDRVVDTWDVVLAPPETSAIPGSIESITEVNRLTRECVLQTLDAGQRPLVLCGDCVSAIACLAGAQRMGRAPYLVWFDAHGDFHTHETTLSGHLGGMPLAMITGRGDRTIPTAAKLDALPDRQVCHVGARDLEPAEAEAFARSEVLLANRLSDALHRIPSGADVWVHIDTDYVTPDEAPAMRYPAAGGPTARDVRSELALLARHTRPIGASVSAWAPHLDPQGETARACWHAISGLFA